MSCRYESQQADLVSVHRVSRQCGAALEFLPWIMLVAAAMFAFLAFHGLALLLAVAAGGLIIRRRSRVVEEAVLLMPTLGIQIETKYSSGRTSYRFVPLQKVLAAVINEAVTPTTCYFYLALILHNEPTLTVVFEHLRPPLGMLRPVWRTLVQEIDKFGKCNIENAI